MLKYSILNMTIYQRLKLYMEYSKIENYSALVLENHKLKLS